MEQKKESPFEFILLLQLRQGSLLLSTEWDRLNNFKADLYNICVAEIYTLLLPQQKCQSHTSSWPTLPQLSAHTHHATNSREVPIV